VNFYGKTSGPGHKLFGRMAPMCEALQLAIYRGAGKPVPPASLSQGMPEWCHKIADKLVLTIFKGYVGLAPQGNIDAGNYGRMVGFFLRAITHFCREVPAELKREGLSDLEPEKEKELESMIDIPALVAFASTKLQRPISNGDELIKAGGEELGRRVVGQAEFLLTFGRYLLNRPVAEQHEFLRGIPDGFILFLNNDGRFTGQRQRTDLYLWLLIYWPEISEMQKGEPPKTCKFLLDWLEKRVEEKLVGDAKQFYGLCGEIGLVMGPPGHPHGSGPA